MSNLYIVATPIGNLEDITLRALSVLKEVSLIASEDTRTTAHLLKHYSIKTPLTSYFEHNKQSKTCYLLDKLEEGNVALVSEAGMPAISDPGYELVVAAQQRGYNVVPIPGASAFIAALSVSGLPTDACHYLGFLPRKAGERRRLLESVAQERVTLAAYEAPHRLLVALHDILQVLGNRRMAVCRELTKLHEEVFRGTVEEAIAHFTQPRGELTIIIDGCTEKTLTLDACDIVSRLRGLKQSGVPMREALSQLAQEIGIPRRELYREWLKLK
ncbi:MAG: 16S rRNA (cytidine(1402)-2'-O)-methyltransferase [Dehalococcoidia bacterium]|nr:16S rRNA (cytidine(1402)-2'-O)-methyltransferase [Dehalococcoidia bacterium]